MNLMPLYSQVCMTQMANGTMVLAYNPSKTERRPLDLALSDDGRSWRTYAVLDSDPSETYQCTSF